MAAAVCAILTIPIAWNSRELISSDGLSYLEVGANTARYGFGYLFANAYWSQLYPAILAVVLKLAHPSLASELIVVRCVDWVICTGTYFSFTWFLLNFLRWIHLARGPVIQNRRHLLVVLAFAYTLLFVCNLDVTLWLAGPHILVEGMVFLAAGACLRLSLPGAGLRHYALFGAILALGFVAKTALFPLSLLLLIFLAIRAVAQRSGGRETAVAAVVFLLGSLPVVAALSYNKGRLTIGDAGKLTYAFYVSGVPRYWEVRQPDTPLPHAPRQILKVPEIVKFDSPFPATYSYWYDPSYWYEGVNPPFDLRLQMRQFLRIFGVAPKFMLSGLTVFQLAARWPSLWMGLAAFTVFGLRAGKIYRYIGPAQSWLFLWPICGFLTFASVLIEYRYLVPFLVLGWTTLFVVAWGLIDSRKWIGATVVVTMGLVLAYGPDYARQLKKIPQAPSSLSNAAVARKLESLGIRAGDQLAGVGFADYAYYARLVGARFTIQIMAGDRDAMAKLPASDVAQILETLRSNGARALYSPYTPAFDNDSGWVKVSSNGYVRML
ncbi:MAG: hypothetical protein ABJC09_05840 [Terriglobia bacterium]